jgi:acyl-CoA thioesterase-2
MTASHPSSERFRQAIALQEVEPGSSDRAFAATAQYVPWAKAYGGDMVAQAAAAALRTVSNDRELHSTHSSFLRPVDIDCEIRYEVDLVRDGRGYSTRHVRGIQNNKTVFLSTASFQVPRPGPTFQPAMPSVPDPDTLPSSAAYLDGIEGDAAAYWRAGRSFDMRHVDGPLYMQVEGRQEPHQAIWIRAFDNLGDDPEVHRLAVAYVCDYTILESTLRVAGAHWSTPGLATASLDHAMWFHTHARADAWLLYAQEAAGMQSSRGLNLGRFFTADGRLVATVAQEGLIQLPETPLSS